MKSLFGKKAAVSYALAAVVFVRPALATQTIDGWNINTDEKGQISTMSVSTPSTPLGIEQDITLQLSSNLSPSTGTVKFRNGVQRDLKTGEVKYYWTLLAGQHAEWDFLASQGKVSSFDTNAIPSLSSGVPARVMTQNGKELIGLLVNVHREPTWFLINVDGTSIYVFPPSVREIQQLK
jgi:hypothetical protein